MREHEHRDHIRQTCRKCGYKNAIVISSGGLRFVSCDNCHKLEKREHKKKKKLDVKDDK